MNAPVQAKRLAVTATGCEAQVPAPAPTPAPAPLGPARWVVDFGQNVNGFVTLTLPAGHGLPAGTAIRIEHGEITYADGGAAYDTCVDPLSLHHTAAACFPIWGVCCLCWLRPGPTPPCMRALDECGTANKKRRPGAQTLLLFGFPAFELFRYCHAATSTRLRHEPCRSHQTYGKGHDTAYSYIGDFNNANQTNVYVIGANGTGSVKDGGHGSVSYTPSFAVAGYRYITVSGLPGWFTPTKAMFTSHFIHTDVDPVGDLRMPAVAGCVPYM